MFYVSKNYNDWFYQINIFKNSHSFLNLRNYFVYIKSFPNGYYAHKFHKKRGVGKILYSPELDDVLWWKPVGIIIMSPLINLGISK